jgi:hypothetical protein
VTIPPDKILAADGVLVPYDVIVECPRCHRPLVVLEEWGPGDARIAADITEDDHVGDSRLHPDQVTNYGARSARVTVTDPAFDPHHTDRTAGGKGRRTIRCVSRYHRSPVSRTVTQAAANDTYWRARAARLTRVSLYDVTADAVQE